MAETACTCGWGGTHDPDNPRCVDARSRLRSEPVTIGVLADLLRRESARLDAEGRRAENRFPTSQRVLGTVLSSAMYAVANLLGRLADGLDGG